MSIMGVLRGGSSRGVSWGLLAGGSHWSPTSAAPLGRHPWRVPKSFLCWFLSLSVGISATLHPHSYTHTVTHWHSQDFRGMSPRVAGCSATSCSSTSGSCNCRTRAKARRQPFKLILRQFIYISQGPFVLTMCPAYIEADIPMYTCWYNPNICT